MSKEDVIKKIKEILAKDRRFDGAKIEIIFEDKEMLNDKTLNYKEE